MKPWEIFLLNILKQAAPTAENLFIHSQRGIAIFNASDAIFNGVVDTVNQAAVAKATEEQTIANRTK